MNKSFIGKAAPALFLTLSLLLHALPVQSATSSFREKFIRYYDTISFLALENLVKKNLSIIPGEIRTLIKESKDEGKDFAEKMYLINLAYRMALFYEDFHGKGDDLLEELRSYQSRLVAEDEAITAELMKWKRLETVPGNFVFKQNRDKTEDAGLAPVLFPHWIHRIWFSCKVCHEEIFKMERWSNRFSFEKIVQGEQCGVCHNGKIAFGPEEECEKCHMAGTSRGEHLHNPGKIDHKKIKAVADRLGSRWNSTKLKNGRLPMDRYGFINWAEMARMGVFSPLTSIDGKTKNEVRDNKILFVSQSPVIKDVLFDHKIHSNWIKCSVCHPSIFKDKLGGNHIKMKDMSQGRFCGRCHGKVSFKFSDCTRCHTLEKGKVAEGVLIRPTSSP